MNRQLEVARTTASAQQDENVAAIESLRAQLVGTDETSQLAIMGTPHGAADVECQTDEHSDLGGRLPFESPAAAVEEPARSDLAMLLSLDSSFTSTVPEEDVPSFSSQRADEFGELRGQLNLVLAECDELRTSKQRDLEALRGELFRIRDTAVADALETTRAEHEAELA